MDEPIKRRESRESRLHEEYYQVDVYYFTVRFSFLGSAEIFRWRPNPWTMSSYPITVDEHRQYVSLTISIAQQNPEEFNRLKTEAKRSAFANLENANKNALEWNAQLVGTVENIFRSHKTTLVSENNFFSAINLKVNKAADGLFTVPTIKKKPTPKPDIDRTQTFSNVPSMGSDTYGHILQLLLDVGRNMERKPSLYRGKDENGLRDFFLSQLEFRYDGVTATGETFNQIGKTDICLKYAPDGTNLFIAECKFWTGHVGFLDTITQLFDRYLTWRDSKVAVMMFVKNQDFTAILNNIRSEIRNHPYYLRADGLHDASSLSYIFCLKQDRLKEVKLEIMAFHFHQI